MRALTTRGVTSFWVAGFIGALGFFHLLLPDLARRWRVWRDLDDPTRPRVRFLGAALVVFSALAATAVFLLP